MLRLVFLSGGIDKIKPFILIDGSRSTLFSFVGFGNIFDVEGKRIQSTIRTIKIDHDLLFIVMVLYRLIIQGNR